MVVTVVTVFASGGCVCLRVTVVPASGVAVMTTVDGGVAACKMVEGGGGVDGVVTGITIVVGGCVGVTTTVTSPLDMFGI